MEAELALAELGGLARWKALRGAGVQPRALKRAVQERAVLRVGHGIYALPGIAPEVTAAMLAGASLGCVSAAAVHGLWVWNRHGMHFSAPRSITVSSGTKVHRIRQGYTGVVPLEVCLRQVMACLPLAEALVITESALAKGLVTEQDLHRLTRGRGSKRAGEVLRAIRPGAESLAETLARHTLVTAGYEVVCQRRVAGVGRVDLEVNNRLLIEIDGRAYHSDAASFAEDRRRWNELTIRGLDLLVLPARYVLADPASVLVPVARYFQARASKAAEKAAD